MNAWTRVLVLTIAVAVFAGFASAVPPAYEGRLGNPEEPALRPYKWMWRGIKALAYQPAKAFRKGNIKTPGLGSVEVFRGLRKGVVELDESVMRGAMGTVPPPAGNYKELGKANAKIDKSPLLRNAADVTTTAHVLGVGGAIGVFAAQRRVDRHPMRSPEEQEEIEARYKARCDEIRLNPAKKMDRINAARARYIGNRIPVPKVPKDTGTVAKAGG